MAQYDETNMGMDPEVKKYFRKIINSFSLFLLWMLVISTAGFRFKLAIVEDKWQWYNVAFYIFSFLLLILLLRYLYKLWKY